MRFLLLPQIVLGTAAAANGNLFTKFMKGLNATDDDDDYPVSATWKQTPQSC
jgi:hypothetical protein